MFNYYFYLLIFSFTIQVAEDIDEALARADIVEDEPDLVEG